MSEQQHAEHAVTLAKEAAFFDEEAGQLSDDALRIPPDVFERYHRARPNSRNNLKEILFARLQPLAGKRVVDYGCGHGENSCLLAYGGAQVTAFDISPGSIAKARRRAELHGLADKIEFHVAAAGATGLPTRSFDHVIGFAILHHLHMMLPTIFQEISTLLKPDGSACFIEPFANSQVLQKMRWMSGVSCYATDDERQLQDRDFKPLYEAFDSVEFVRSYFLERLHRVSPNFLHMTYRTLDYYLLRGAPFLRSFYGKALVIARGPRASKVP